jgi:hypothetical protein
MFYQQLTIPIHELENKKQMKCVYLSPEQKIDTEVTLYPNKNGTVADLVIINYILNKLLFLTFSSFLAILHISLFAFTVAVLIFFID